MGQWLWLEKATGIPITQTLAEHLLSESTQPATAGQRNLNDTLRGENLL